MEQEREWDSKEGGWSEVSQRRLIQSRGVV